MQDYTVVNVAKAATKLQASVMASSGLPSNPHSNYRLVEMITTFDYDEETALYTATVKQVWSYNKKARVINSTKHNEDAQ